MWFLPSLDNLALGPDELPQGPRSLLDFLFLMLIGGGRGLSERNRHQFVVPLTYVSTEGPLHMP